MINMKSLGLAVLAGTLLWALIGAGTAMGAANFCTVQESPCPEASKWTAGTTLDFTLKSGTKAKLASTVGETLEECTGSTLKGKLEKAEPVTTPVESLTWSGCNFPTTTTELGKLKVVNAATLHSGTVKGDSESRITVNGGFFGSCLYGLGSGTDLGELKEGKPASLVVNAVVTKLSGSATACPETAKWTAEYTLAEPSEKTLSVEEGPAAEGETVFCSIQVEKVACPKANRWEAGTTLDFSLKAGAKAKLVETAKEGLFIDECTGATLKGKLEKAELVTVPVESLTFTGCFFAPAVTTKPGKIEVEHIAGTHNGTVKADAELAVKFNTVFFGICIYGITEGAPLGELKEGKPATLIFNAVGEKGAGSGMICPESAVWTAEYTLTEPKEKTLSVETN